MKYEIDEINHPGWLNKVPWYNTAICSRLHGSLIEDSITHARTEIYNIMCSLVAHYLKKPAYEYEESSIGDMPIPKNSTAEELETLGVTFNFIDIWLKMLDDTYYASSVAYNAAMKDMFKNYQQ